MKNKQKEWHPATKPFTTPYTGRFLIYIQGASGIDARF
jgi:hypothetical protein